MRQRPKSVAEAKEMLRKLEASKECFYSDPMTAYCGCVDDFAEDFDNQERLLWGYIASNASGADRECVVYND